MNFTLLSKAVKLGTAGFAAKDARRLWILNGVSFVAAAIGVVFFVRYAVEDWPRLYPLCVWNAIFIGLWCATPICHRFGLVAGPTYFLVVTTLGFIVFAFLAGSSAGVHYQLLAAPAFLLLTGPQRPLFAAAMVVLMLGGFFLIEFAMPKTSEIAPLPIHMINSNLMLSLVNVSAILFGGIYYSLRLATTAEEALEREYARSETLLYNLVPMSIAERLKNQPDAIIADQFQSVTILFADIVGFTPRTAHQSPEDTVQFLNMVFSEFDRLVESHRLEKIKTIGDAYMVAGGLPEMREGHAAAVAEMALDMLDVVDDLAARLGDDLTVRIGIHTGPAVAGVIGTRKLFYDVWGDTVNTAARMESHGSGGKIQVTAEAMAAIGSRHQFERRGTIEVKGKGTMELYYLTGKQSAL